MVAGFLHSFVRHADVLKIANLAQIVNVIAPILTRGDELLSQSIFYPFKMFSRRRDGIALQVVVDGPDYESASYGTVPYIDASAILAERALYLFATNRSLDEPAEIRINLANRSIHSLGAAELLTGDNPKAANSFGQPDVVTARPFTEVTIVNNQAVCRVPPLSVVAMMLTIGD